MRYITEQELRDAFAQELPARYSPPVDARLTPAARQYLMDLRLYHAPPVHKSTQKPEAMTHLNAQELVRKDDARIVLRGKLDSLAADILCAQTAALRLGCPATVDGLEDALGLVRSILACDFRQAPLPEWTLGGLCPDEVRSASHNPRQYLPEGHVPPTAGQGEVAALLNRLRAVAREVEVQAVATYAHCLGASEDRVLALNRLSSYFYILQLQAIAAGGEGTHGS